MMRRMVLVFAGFGLLISTAVFAARQTASPGLQQRSSANDEDMPPPMVPSNSTGSQISTLPDDVSGPYAFDRRDESIEIDIVHNEKTGKDQLSGYISRRGDEQTDNDTPLTYFFDTSSIDGSEIEFSTKVVHGIWYSFRGTIFRGEGQTRADNGYYILHGTLNMHHSRSGNSKSADETVETRNVHYKSLPQ